MTQSTCHQQEAATATRVARCVWAALHVLILSALALWDSDLRAAARAGDGVYVGLFSALLTAEVALFAALSASDPGFCEPHPRAWRPPGAGPALVRCQGCTGWAFAYFLRVYCMVTEYVTACLCLRCGKEGIPAVP